MIARFYVNLNKRRLLLLLLLTIVLVEDAVDDRVAAARQKDEDLNDDVAVNEHLRRGKAWPARRILGHAVDDGERRHLHHVIRQLADAEHSNDDQDDAGHARVQAAQSFHAVRRRSLDAGNSAAHGQSRRGRRRRSGTAGSPANPKQQQEAEGRDDDKRSNKSEDQRTVRPDTMNSQRRPVYLAAGLVSGGRNHLAEEPVRRREGQADGPYRRARHQAAADLPEASELVEGGQESVDAECDEGVDAGELVALLEDGRHLAGEGVQRPVADVGGVADKRQRQHEQFVGERQIPDVVIADRAHANFLVLGDDVDDKGVADQAEHEGDEVEGQGYRSNVAVYVSRGVVRPSTSRLSAARNR